MQKSRRNKRKIKNLGTVPGSGRRTTLVPLGAIAAGFTITAAWGADAPASVERPVAVAAAAADPDTLPGVTVTGNKDKQGLRTTTSNVGKGNQDIRDIPQSLTVEPEQMLEDLKLNSLRDALRYTAGITFAAAENGTDQDIRLRGFPIGTTGDLMIDGMRDPSQYERDTFNFERVEVLRGSASMLFGRGSTGGVVNQVSKKAELVDQSDVIGSVGDRGYFRTTIDVNKRIGETSAFRLNAMETKAENDGAKIDKHGIAPTVRFGIGTPDELSIGLFYLNVNNVPMAAIRWINNGPGTQGTISNIDPQNFYGMASDYQKGKAQYGTVAYQHRFDDGGVFRAQARNGAFDRQNWSTSAGPGAPPINPVTVTRSNLNDDTIFTRAGLTPRKDRYLNTYYQGDYSNTFDLLGMRHDVLTGFDGGFERAKRFQNNGFANPLGTRPTISVGSPDDGTKLAVSPIYRESSAYGAQSVGAFAQDLVSLTPNWKLLGGVRWDSFKGDFKNIVYSNTTGLRTGDTTAHIDDAPWSYRGGILFQPSPTKSFHVSYGTSFNTSADTYQYVTPQTANTPPEKSRNIEVGAKLDWLDNTLSTRFAIFRTEKYNERTTDADFASTTFLLSGKRHSQGVEVDIVGKITEKLELYVSASYIPTSIIDKAGSSQQNIVGQRVGLTPRTTGGAYLTYEPIERMRIGVGVHGASRNYALQGTNGAAQSTNKAPGYAVCDLLAEYRFTPDLFAQINLFNVANKAYADQLYPAFYIAGPARSVQGTIGVRF